MMGSRRPPRATLAFIVTTGTTGRLGLLLALVCILTQAVQPFQYLSRNRKQLGLRSWKSDSTTLSCLDAIARNQPKTKRRTVSLHSTAAQDDIENLSPEAGATGGRRTTQRKRRLDDHATTASAVAAATTATPRMSLPRRALRIYTEYAGRLWNETSPEARRRIANNREVNLILAVRDIIQSNKYFLSSTDISFEARKRLLDACEGVLEEMGTNMTRFTYLASDSNIIESNNIIIAPASSTVLEEENGSHDVQALLNIDNTIGRHESHTSPHIVDDMQMSLRFPASSSSSSSSFTMLPSFKGESTATARHSTPTEVETTPPISGTVMGEKPKKRRSILFGATMGMVVAGWVFSGNYIFTGLFTLMTILGQLEYYRMVMNRGIFPTRKINVVGACMMFLTALFTPELHQICLPLFGLYTMIWLLTMKRSSTTIPEIATSFTGMFYLGYVPSFWVRTRLIGGGREPTRLAPIAAPILQFLQRKAEANLPGWVVRGAVHLPITTGAIFIFWSWLCIAFSDVGAYFVGKNFGKTKLGKISPAAGATSPNKTVEGVVGGCLVSAVLGIMGAWVQRWPLFWFTGAVHGLLLSLLGLIGDLTASMLKRDAGLKDFGDLIPEHGGIMDRVDSFVWSAPYCWLVCAYVIPALKTVFPRR